MHFFAYFPLLKIVKNLYFLSEVATIATMWHDYRVTSVLKGFQSFVIIILFLLWLTTGNVEALYAFLVVWLVYFPVKFLKKTACAIDPAGCARPFGASDCRAFKGANSASDDGMPSGHSAGAAVMTVYTLCYIWMVAETSVTQRVVASFFVVCLGLLIAWSRVVYSCHTRAQVFVGSLIGLAWGVGAFTLRENALARLKMSVP